MKTHESETDKSIDVTITSNNIEMNSQVLKILLLLRLKTVK